MKYAPWTRWKAWIDLAARALRYRLKVDPQEISLICQILEPGNFVVDVGAHKGGYLFWFHKAVGPQGKICAFEPQEELYEYLTHLVDVLGWENVQVQKKAVSNFSGQTNFYRMKERSSTGASLSETAFQENQCKIEVDVVTLDDWCSQEASFRPVDMIKIDVESFEKEVLEGAREILIRDRPFLLFEGEKRISGEKKILDTFQYLEGLAFQGYFFYNKQIHPLKNFDFKVHQNIQTKGFPNTPLYSNNFVFCSRPEHLQKLEASKISNSPRLFF